MRKFLATISVVLLIFATSCMMGEDGDTYLAYSWTSLPLYLYDDNPSIPDVITNGEYYRTQEGVFYMEYTAWDGSDWSATYTITANPGEMFSNGAPSYFEISLNSFGPSLYEWSYPRSTESQTERPKEGFEKLTLNGYTIELEYQANDQN